MSTCCILVRLFVFLSVLSLVRVWESSKWLHREDLAVVRMASGPRSAQLGASDLALAAALFLSRWQEAKLGSNVDPEVLADAESALVSSIDVALNVLGAGGAGGWSSGAFSVAAEVGAGGGDGVSDALAPVVEDPFDDAGAGCDLAFASRRSIVANDEAWNALLCLANVESEVVSLFRKHRETAAAAYVRSSAEPVVWLFVDFDMFESGTGFESGQATALWDRWRRIVSSDRIWARGSKIVVALDELRRD